MIAVVVPLLFVLVVLTGYTLLVLAVCAPQAYRNGYAQAQRDARETTPSHVTVLPRQRGKV